MLPQKIILDYQSTGLYEIVKFSKVMRLTP